MDSLLPGHSALSTDRFREKPNPGEDRSTGRMIGELRSRGVDDSLGADIEIYHQAALWKMA